MRNNVRGHLRGFRAGERFQLLARSAYEYQYLRFSGISDPWRYYSASTWIREQFAGVLSDEGIEEIFGAVSAICDCYRIDRSRFVPEAASR